MLQGRYLTEQTMTFCQVVMKRELVDKLKGPEGEYYKRFREKIDPHRRDHKEDPLGIPFDDLDPQATIPVSTKFPWHAQIQRDAFSYGAVPLGVDKRVIVDFRFFGMTESRESNRVKFEDKIKDGYHMPQPTFEFSLTTKEREDAHEMMRAMEMVAGEFGGYLPGSEPQYMAPGLALHVCGTTRAGFEDDNKSCCDKNSKVWKFPDLYLGGPNVIPRKNASNPTLTAMCFAIKGAENLYKELTSGHN